MHPKYVDVIMQRWQGLIGSKAIQAATGRPFEIEA
jgi:hypothetical protein